jgi:hypothetical protein
VSYIDTLRHQLCGTLAGLPVYLLQETYNDSVTADVGDLLLGGGSGEHAAAVAHVRACAASYLDKYGVAVLEAADDEVGVLGGAAQAYGVTGEQLLELSDILKAEDGRDPVDFTTWGSCEWVSFSAAASSWPFGHSFDSERDGRLEMWVADALGEYVLVSATHILGETAAGNHAAWPAMLRLISRTPLLATVASWPSGYLVGGRGEVLGEPNMRH